MTNSKESKATKTNVETAIVAEKVDTKAIAPETKAEKLQNSPAMPASDKDQTVIVDGRPLKLAKGISYDGNGKFTDAHGRNTNSIGWTAGRYIGVGLNHLVNAYELDPSLAEKLSAIVDELIPVRDSYRVVIKGASNDPEVLKQKLEKSMAKMAKQQEALLEKIRLAELAQSKKAE